MSFCCMDASLVCLTKEDGELPFLQISLCHYSGTAGHITIRRDGYVSKMT